MSYFILSDNIVLIDWEYMPIRRKMIRCYLIFRRYCFHFGLVYNPHRFYPLICLCSWRRGRRIVCWCRALLYSSWCWCRCITTCLYRGSSCTCNIIYTTTCSSLWRTWCSSRCVNWCTICIGLWWCNLSSSVLCCISLLCWCMKYVK